MAAHTDETVTVILRVKVADETRVRELAAAWLYEEGHVTITLPDGEAIPATLTYVKER